MHAYGHTCTYVRTTHMYVRICIHMHGLCLFVVDKVAEYAVNVGNTCTNYTFVVDIRTCSVFTCTCTPLMHLVTSCTQRVATLDASRYFHCVISSVTEIGESVAD